MIFKAVCAFPRIAAKNMNTGTYNCQLTGRADGHLEDSRSSREKPDVALNDNLQTTKEILMPINTENRTMLRSSSEGGSTAFDFTPGGG